MLGVVLADAFNLKPGGLASNLQDITITEIVSAALLLLLVLAAIAFFFMLVIGGVRWITSGGDKAQTESARGQITAAIIGLIVVFSAWAITSLIELFFGIDLFGGLNITPVGG